MTNRYRVILQIECDDAVVLRQMGKGYLDKSRQI